MCAIAMDVHAALPECSSLDLVQARQLAGHLRGTLRPFILQRLKELRGLDGIDAFINRQELDMRLTELHHYGRQLDSRIAQLQPLTPAETVPLELFDVEKGENWICARAPCYLTPESEYFIHGPVALAHIIALAERFVGEDGGLRVIEKVEFKSQMSNQLAIWVWDEAAPMPRTHASCLNGSILCGNNRRLLFQAEQIPDLPVTELAGANRLAQAILPMRFEMDVQRDAYIFDLAADAFDGMDKAVPLPIYAYTLMDVSIMATIRTEGQDGRTQLFLQARDIPLLPDFPEVLRQGLRYETKIMRQQSRMVDGVRFVPARYRLYPLQSGFSRIMIGEIDGSMADRFAR